MNVIELINKIQEAREAYYNDEPIMSDAEFDALIRQLKKIDPKNVVLSQVGAPVKSKEKVSHNYRMGSLDNAMQVSEFDSWYKKISKHTKSGKPELIIMPKMDGVSLDLIYNENGSLIKAITRGDGIEGEDVWHTVAHIPSIPKVIECTKNVSIRGEIMILRKDFDKFEGAANCRNAASGTLRRSDHKGAEHLKFFAYALLGHDLLETHGEALDWLEDKGFTIVAYDTSKSHDFIVKRWEAWGMYRESEGCEFDMDGCVVRINSLSLSNRIHAALGRDENDDPGYAVAFKWEEKPVQTILKDIEYQVGMTGAITPVALLKPVSIGGTIVKRASLMNYEEAERLGVYIHDTVNVIKSGEIIPRVIGVAMPGKGRIGTPLEAWKRPSTCPSCGAKTEEDGPRQMCYNLECPEQNVGRIVNWCAKRSIMGVGPEIAAKLIAGGIDTIPKLYVYSAKDFIKVIGSVPIGEKVYHEIQKSRATKLSDLVGSLCIHGVGRTEAEKLVQIGYDTVEHITNIREEDLLCHAGYKTVKARKIIEGIRSASDTIIALKRYLTLEAPIVAASNEMEGWSICFTGCRPTDEEENAIKSKGGKLASGVSKSTTHLVCKSKGSGSSKESKASELGVKILTYAEFQKLV